MHIVGKARRHQRVTAWIGRRFGEQMIERREVIAGNDAIHSKLHKLVANALR